MSKSKKSSTSILYSVFVGNQVTIIVKNIKTGGSRSKITNLMFAGFLLDECEDYVYIGQTAEEISAAIKKEEIAGIVLGEPTFAQESEIPEDAEIQ